MFFFPKVMRSSLLLGRRLLHLFSPAGIESHAASTKVHRVNHLAVAVPNLGAAAAFYRDVLGIENVSEKPDDLLEHGVSVVFVSVGGVNIELLHPHPKGNEQSPIASFLKRNPHGGLHHVCFEVKDLEGTLGRLRELNKHAIDERPKRGAHGRPVVFLHPRDCGGVLVELEQVN